MGVANNAIYLQYFEVGRIEYLRALGHSYAEVHDGGIDMVVVEAGIRYLQPLRFDDEVLVECDHRRAGPRLVPLRLPAAGRRAAARHRLHAPRLRRPRDDAADPRAGVVESLKLAATTGSDPRHDGQLRRRRSSAAAVRPPRRRPAAGCEDRTRRPRRRRPTPARSVLPRSVDRKMPSPAATSTRSWSSVVIATERASPIAGRPSETTRPGRATTTGRRLRRRRTRCPAR